VTVFAQVPLFPEQGSTVSHEVDAVFFFELAVSGVMGVLIAALVIGFAVRYRERPGRGPTPHITHSNAVEVFWSVVPLIVFLAMFVWGARLYYFMARPPDDALEIYVVGKQWMWKIQHPEGQREINELHIPVGRPVKLKLVSEDVIHDFFVPAFRTKVDVLPGRYVQMWFEAAYAGEFRFFCSQYCGTNHSGMVGKVVALEPADYEAWLGGRAEGSLALAGRKLFLKLQCVTCHSADSQARAPVLENLYRRTVTLQDGSTVVADEAYIRESILKPEAKVVAGWQPIMPTFLGQVSEEDIIALIAYIKSLQPGQTPVRTEEATPPQVQTGEPGPPATGSRSGSSGR
jgi:cytochrome c oxidase subunit 2